MTGVIGKYRGKGIATFLKLNTIRYAHDHGKLEIRTVNDAVNAAVLALNAKLGFKQFSTAIRYVKYLGETPDSSTASLDDEFPTLTK